MKSECRVFKAPPYVIRAVTRGGQRWVNDVTEKGVRVCGWERPGPPPPEEYAVPPPS